MCEKFKIGDYFLSNGHYVRATSIDETKISAGLLDSVPVEKAMGPKLTDGFFSINDFTKRDGSFFLGTEETFIKATPKEKFYEVVVKNRVYYFMGYVDEVNHLLHILDDCAITSDLVCE